MDWFSLILGAFIGFIIGRYYRLAKKVLKAIKKESKEEEV